MSSATELIKCGSLHKVWTVFTASLPHIEIQDEGLAPHRYSEVIKKLSPACSLINAAFCKVSPLRVIHFSK